MRRILAVLGKVKYQNSDFLGNYNTYYTHLFRRVYSAQRTMSLRALIRGHPIAVAVIFVRYLLIDINKKRTRGFGYVFYVLSLLFENRLQGNYGVAVAAVRSKSQVLFGKGDIFVHAETVEVAHADIVLRDRQVLLCRLHIV